MADIGPFGPSPGAGERRFWAGTLIVGAPPFLAVWGFFAVFALTQGGTQAGAVLGIIWLPVAALCLVQPYVATLRPDGSLTFKALTGTITTTADAISRIAISGGRSSSFVFYFAGGKASLGMMGGRTLARYLVARNPMIDRPKRF